jgi:hypothetical protein
MPVVAKSLALATVLILELTTLADAAHVSQSGVQPSGTEAGSRWLKLKSTYS